MKKKYLIIGFNLYGIFTLVAVMFLILTLHIFLASLLAIAFVIVTFLLNLEYPDVFE